MEPSGGTLRVVSLVPSTTETIFALGRGHLMVGVTDYCTRPRVMPPQVERVGGTKTPDMDRIRRLRPDLVLANFEENRKEDVLALAEWTEVEVAHPRTVEEALRDIERLGALLGARKRADDLVRRIEHEIDLLHTAARAFRYAYLVWRDPWMAAGPETYISDLLSLGGGRNVIGAGAGAGRYPTLELDALARLAPDVVMLPDEPYQFGAEHVREIAALLGAEWTHRCHLVSGEDFCWHGARLLEGLPAYRRWLSKLDPGIM